MPAPAKRDGVNVRVFLMGDAVVAALAGQQVPDGYYHLDRMITSMLRRGGEGFCCGTCMAARAIEEKQLVEGTMQSNMEQLADWTLEAGRIVTF